MRQALVTLVLATGCVTFAGCSILSPRPDLSRFFTLTPTVQKDSGASIVSGVQSERLTYGLGPIKLPEYLDRHEIATRLSPTEVSYSQTDRWAEQLSDTVRSVLLQDLSALLDTDRILPYPWMGNVKVDYQVVISLLRFETDTAGATQLTARWTIRDVRNAHDVVAKETALTRPGPPGDSSAAAAALSGILGDFSREIAAALQQLPPPQAPQPPASKPT